MSKPHQEQLLQELYSKSKQQVTLPNDVKANVLSHAKKSRYPLSFLMNWQTACALVVVGWLWFDNSRAELPTYSITQTYTEDNQLVYYHQVDYHQVSDNTLASNKQPYQSIALTENPQYFAYLQSLSKLQSANQLAGIVRSSNDDVVVEICQLGLIKLAPSVLASMAGGASIDEFSQGQNILLTADNRGKILAIEPQTSGQLCTG